MPLSASPRLPAAEISGDIPQEDCKAVFGTEVPACAPNSPQAATQPYKEDMSTVTANQANMSCENNFAQHTYMPLNSDSMQWLSQGYSTPRNLPQDDPVFGGPTYFTADSSFTEHPQHARNGLSFNSNYPLGNSGDHTANHLRSFDNNELFVVPRDMAPSFPPSAFFHSPPDAPYAHSPVDASTSELTRIDDHYDMHYSGYSKHDDQVEFSGLSPYSKMSRASTPYSTGYDDDEPIDKEQPYAQLIYRALLDAPQHTMVLRDIYDWFRMHTDKAAHSETKGWQNSIRHNLSMNGAFEKVDSPVDASAKGFMWRLTEAALREGVKSTTRYRSKVPTKRSPHRAQPLPQRQASGAKGGHATRRAANQRRSQRMRDTYHAVPRSDPYPVSHYATDWDNTHAFAPSPAFPSRVNTPYSSTSFSPYHDAAPKDTLPFDPMLGLPSHLASPPRSYANTPVMVAEGPSFMALDAAGFALEHAGEPLFSGSPTPPVDEPVTPVVAGGGGFYEEMGRFGGMM